VVAAIEAGASRRQAAKRVGVGEASAVRWHERFRQDGPMLRSGDTVILDNRSAHKVAGVREAIEAVGARVLDRPPDSPDSDPIERAFAKVEALLRTERRGPPPT
jgi:transposase-like protein